MTKRYNAKTKPRQDYNQPQALTCSLGGYSHREHCRAPDDKNYTSKQETIHQLSYAVENVDFIFNDKIETAQVRRSWSSRLDIGSNITRRPRRSSSRNH